MIGCDYCDDDAELVVEYDESVLGVPRHAVRRRQRVCTAHIVFAVQTVDFAGHGAAKVNPIEWELGK